MPLPCVVIATVSVPVRLPLIAIAPLFAVVCRVRLLLAVIVPARFMSLFEVTFIFALVRTPVLPTLKAVPLKLELTTRLA